MTSALTHIDPTSLALGATFGLAIGVLTVIVVAMLLDNRDRKRLLPNHGRHRR